MKCDICGEELTKEEEVVLDSILSDMTPCYCSIAKTLAKLQDDTFIRMSPETLKEFRSFMKKRNKSLSTSESKKLS